MRCRKLRLEVALGVSLAVLVGCSSLSESSKSASTLVSSPITSLWGSSSPTGAYQDDVRAFTAAHVQSGGDAAGLLREIGSIAEDHGVTDWENNAATYRGVGEGLARARYRQLEVDAFKKNLAQTKQQAEWIQEGYEAAR